MHEAGIVKEVQRLSDSGAAALKTKEERLLYFLSIEEDDRKGSADDVAGRSVGGRMSGYRPVVALVTLRSREGWKIELVKERGRVNR